MSAKFILTILISEHLSDEEVPKTYRIICQVESEQPFPAINKGDLIDPRAWKGSSFDTYTELFEYGDLFEVELVCHHIAQEKDGSYGQHVIDIFTNIIRKRVLLHGDKSSCRNRLDS